MKPISTPGVFDVEISAYHHDPHLCDGPSISSSGLRTLLFECPARYFAFSPYNPNRFPDESTKALDIGRAAHALVLGEPEFLKYFVISPYDDFRTKEARAWRDEQTKTVLKSDEFANIEAVAAALRRSPQVMRAFEDGAPEKSLIFQDKETGIWLKARPDWLPHDPAKRLIVEYKTAVSVQPRRWASQAFALGYHIQSALQIDAARSVLGIEPLGVAHCVQEKDPPYIAELRLFSTDQIEWGRKQYRRALQIFSECLRSGVWPSYTNEASYTETPSHVARDMDIGWTDEFYKPEKAVQHDSA